MITVDSQNNVWMTDVALHQVPLFFKLLILFTYYALLIHQTGIRERLKTDRTTAVFMVWFLTTRFQLYL
jgi:hypothetical protein